jgi:hypothetical protein
MCVIFYFAVFGVALLPFFFRRFSSFFAPFFIFPAPCLAARRQRIGATAADRVLFFTQTLFFA